MTSYEIELEHNTNLTGVEGAYPWGARVKSIDGQAYPRKDLSVRGQTKAEVQTKIHELISRHSKQQENVSKSTYTLNI